MTIIRLLFFLWLLCLCAWPVLAEPPKEVNSQTLVQLRHENVALQRKVRRLEAQVTAMRDELNTPGLSQIAGGVGYIVGVFGVTAWISARKKEGQGN